LCHIKICSNRPSKGSIPYRLQNLNDAPPTRRLQRLQGTFALNVASPLHLCHRVLSVGLYAIYWNQGIVLHRGGHIGFSKTPSPIPKDEVSEMFEICREPVYLPHVEYFKLLKVLILRSTSAF